MKKLKFRKLALFTLALGLLSIGFVACTDKDEFNEDLNQIELNGVLGNHEFEVPSVLTAPVTTKWVKKKADRFEGLISLLDDYYYIPSGGIADLDWCQERLDVANYSGLNYELLTLATDLASMELAGINLDDAKILQGGMWLGIHDLGYQGVGVVDQLSNKNSLDASTLANLNPLNLEYWINEFVLNHCVDCVPSDRMSISEIQGFVALAQQLPPLISYHDTGSCLRTNGILIAPGATKWVKKKAD